MQEKDQATGIRYSMQIAWSPEDNVYIVAVPELPGLHTHGVTYEEAVAMGQEAIGMYLTALRNTGRSAPPPRFYCDAEANEVRASA